jgi:3-hydroxyacyl-[acyl-carrier-protein] dehydratase
LESLDVNEIRKYLPHRYPFLLVDRVIECVPRESLVAIKNVTINEPFFEGHFPHRPVMPGVLILEAIAQASAILASTEFEPDEIDVENRIYLFAGLDKARFKRPVEPGDQLRIETKISRRIRNMWKCEGRAMVDDELACSAVVMFTYKDL